MSYLIDELYQSDCYQTISKALRKNPKILNTFYFSFWFFIGGFLRKGTLLHFACYYNRIKCVELLLKHGANREFKFRDKLKFYEGYKAIEIAERHKYVKIQKLFDKYESMVPIPIETEYSEQTAIPIDVHQASIQEQTPKLSCKEAVLLIQCIPYISEIVKICEEHIKTFLSEPTNNDKGLTYDELFALVLITCELVRKEDPFRAKYKKEDNFYFHFKKAQQRQRQYPEEKKEWATYLFYLQKALSKFPDVEMEVLRGLKEVDINEYWCMRIVRWSGYTSTTTELSTATLFAGNNGVIMKIKVKTGKDISRYSYFPKEKEILLTPNMEYLVIKCYKEIYKDLTFIELCQMDTLVY